MYLEPDEITLVCSVIDLDKSSSYSADNLAKIGAKLTLLGLQAAKNVTIQTILLSLLSSSSKSGPLKYTTFSGPEYEGSGNRIACTTNK